MSSKVMIVDNLHRVSPLDILSTPTIFERTKDGTFYLVRYRHRIVNWVKEFTEAEMLQFI